MTTSKTAREIAQQPLLWREVGRTAAARRGESTDFLRPLFSHPNLRIVLTGAGTSAFIGELLAPALSRQLGRRVDAVATTDIVSNPREAFAEDCPTLLVSFARSGDSPESIAATELATACLSTVHHLIVTCNPDGKLFHRYVDDDNAFVLQMPELANDQGFAMTSSFTCMLLSTWLTFTTMANSAIGDESVIERLAVAGEQMMAERATDVRALAVGGFTRIVYLGSGPLTGLARESALKLLELTAGTVVSYFDSALGFRHGPKSVVDEHTLVIVYLSNDAYTRAYDLDIIDELRGVIGPDRVVVIGARTGDTLHEQSGWYLDGLADIDDAIVSLPFVVAAQLLGLEFSLALGVTPDNPFPDGQVNRVVRGVTIHSFPSLTKGE